MADITAVATNLGREATAKARAFTETNSVAKKAKDVVYTAVGLGVLGVQKTTAAVKHVHGSIDTEGVHASVRSSVDTVTTSVKKQATKVDETVGKTIKKVDETVAPLEEKFPSPVRQASAKAREATSKAHATVSAKLNPTDAEAAPAKADKPAKSEKSDK